MDAWDVQDKAKPMGWTVVDGTMTNTPHANNLISKQKFQDYKIHAEYKLEQNSNSGIYIRGRYELQVLDDFGKPPFERGHMSIYGWQDASRQREQAGRGMADDGSHDRGQQGHRRSSTARRCRTTRRSRPSPAARSTRTRASLAR